MSPGGLDTQHGEQPLQACQEQPYQGGLGTRAPQASLREEESPGLGQMAAPSQDKGVGVPSAHCTGSRAEPPGLSTVLLGAATAPSALHRSWLGVWHLPPCKAYAPCPPRLYFFPYFVFTFSYV